MGERQCKVVRGSSRLLTNFALFFCFSLPRGGRVVGGDRRIPSYSGDYRYAREDKDVDVQLLLFESFGGFGKGVGEILWGAANVLCRTN